ncbi:hypothetical protein [Deinococcus aestuarii]|uniref:hypothetical protein n=1 Tax=Deinococcus aestuarii TaxID=2774531 RepID=UPI001C0C44CC|nr:hypothetical protein [Deinococcus aestuarii]
MEAAWRGFNLFGSWQLEETWPVFKLLGTDQKYGLYALMVDGKVMYVGKCKDGFLSRMGMFRNPPPSQQTHYRLSPLIRAALLAGQRMETAVLALPDATLQELKERRDALVREHAPAWNRYA